MRPDRRTVVGSRRRGQPSRRATLDELVELVGPPYDGSAQAVEHLDQLRGQTRGGPSCPRGLCRCARVELCSERTRRRCEYLIAGPELEVVEEGADGAGHAIRHTIGGELRDHRPLIFVRESADVRARDVELTRKVGS